jgi:cell division inhibitor SulA/protein ImuA
MSGVSKDHELGRLLEHPAIWRGSSAARLPGIPTGFAALDACLPGRGWPCTGLIELLPARFGSGELELLLPALSALTCRPASRGSVWVAPPDLPATGEADGCALEPFAPALAAAGLVLERVLMVRPAGPAAALWAFEQALGSGGCESALVWLHRARPLEIRRLQLAAERGRTLGVLFRPGEAAHEPSPAMLRLQLAPMSQGVRVTILKSRGGTRGSIELSWQESGRLQATEAGG